MTLGNPKPTGTQGVSDTGWSKELTDMMKEHNVTIGIHQAKDTRDDGQGNADIGFRHEYGVGVPERSFLRATTDAGTAKYRRAIKKIYLQVGKGVISLDAGLSLIGHLIANDVKKKIRSNIPPELAEATVNRKGSSTALIDTGQLINAIDYEVT